MAYVLTNGKYYIKMTDTGATAKTNNINEARVFLTTDKAKERMQKAPGKTKGYYIYDLDTKSRYHIRNNRIKFPKQVRSLIYNNADGRCVLCGRKILYEDMTLDHIVPLVMNGADDVRNLQATCKICNQFKGSILPDEFMERITDIFMYQMERKYNDKVKWKIVHRLLLSYIR